MTSTEQVLDALRQVIHPEMKRDLVTLDMVRDVRVEREDVQFTLVLPFKEVPIRDDLVRSARQAVEALI